MAFAFEISDEDIKKIEEWDKCKNKKHGAIGGHITYEFVPTGLGVFYGIKCSSCGERLDLTDYNDM